MKSGKLLLLIDAIINLFLGVVLLAYSEFMIDMLGLPETGQKFYPNILGAILFGIGIALVIETRRTGAFIGLGLGGAIVINLMGGMVLFIWLLSGMLDIPIKGMVILWSLDFILLIVSSLELVIYLRSNSK